MQWASRRRWEIGLGVALTVMFVTWIVGTPRYGAPDELSHTVKAYGTAHGETLGDDVTGASPLLRSFDAPATLASGDPACYAFQPSIPASCSPVHADTTIIGIPTSAGTYPPWYYAVVGGVARVTGTDTSVRAYRLVSTAGVVAMVLAAFVLAGRARRRRPALVLLALTPMTIFVVPSVNPGSWEIAGVLLLWMLVAHHLVSGAEPTRRRLLGATSLGAAVVLVRPVALPWVALALGTYLLLEPRLHVGGIRPTLRRIAVPCVPLVVAGLASVAWSRYAGVSLADDKYLSDAGRIEDFRVALGRTGWVFEQFVGVLGWVDTWIPFAAVALVTVGLVLALGLVAAAAPPLVRLIAAVLVAVWFVYPVFYVTLARTPLVWQGRYNLPLLGGLVLCLILVGMDARWADIVDRLAAYLAVAFVVAQVLAFHQMLRRFMVGSGGDLWLRDPAWYPSVNAWLLIVVNAAATAAVATLALRNPARADR